MHTVLVTSNGYAFKASSEDFDFMMDGKGMVGMSPSGALLASLGGCVSLYIRKYADSTKLAIKEINVTVESDFAKEPVIHFKEIKIKIDLPGFKFEDERRKQAFLNFIGNCPVHNTLEHKPKVGVEVKER